MPAVIINHRIITSTYLVIMFGSKSLKMTTEIEAFKSTFLIQLISQSKAFINEGD
ncbi:MAG: hypothetical protein GY928_40350 [Colwellia sp.]|nr:hypothetical protein [Colwellia sp.]